MQGKMSFYPPQAIDSLKDVWAQEQDRLGADERERIFAHSFLQAENTLLEHAARVQNNRSNT